MFEKDWLATRKMKIKIALRLKKMAANAVRNTGKRSPPLYIEAEGATSCSC